MERVLNYIFLGVCVFLVILLTTSQCSNNKYVKEISKLKDELYACKNAPVKTDTVYVYDTIVEIKYLRPKPSTNPNTQTQTISNCDKVKQVYYSDTYEKSGAKIHWEALTTCNNDSALIDYIRFPEIVIPSKIVTNTKILHDTVKVDVPMKLRGKFVVYGGLVLNNIKTFSGIEAGIGYLHKQSWMLTAGPTYINNNIYGSLRISVTF